MPVLKLQIRANRGVTASWIVVRDAEAKQIKSINDREIYSVVKAIGSLTVF